MNMKKKAYETLIIQLSMEYKLEDRIKHPLIIIDVIKLLKEYKPIFDIKGGIKIKKILK